MELLLRFLKTLSFVLIGLTIGLFITVSWPNFVMWFMLAGLFLVIFLVVSAQKKMGFIRKG